MIKKYDWVLFYLTFLVASFAYWNLISYINN